MKFLGPIVLSGEGRNSQAQIDHRQHGQLVRFAGYGLSRNRIRTQLIENHLQGDGPDGNDAGLKTHRKAQFGMDKQLFLFQLKQPWMKLKIWNLLMTISYQIQDRKGLGNNGRETCTKDPLV